MLLADERHALAEAGRRLARSGLVIGTSGNLSARSGGLVAVTPTGGVLSELAAGQMTVIDLDGRVADGDLVPTSEVPMHLAVYRATGAGAIAHAHAVTSIALGLVADEIPVVHYAMLALGGAIRVAPYARYGTETLATLVAQALDGKRAALLRNHGSIATGVTLAAAVDNLELAEWAARVYHQALLAAAVTGREPRPLTRREQDEVAAAVLASGYGTTRAVSPGDSASHQPGAGQTGRS